MVEVHEGVFLSNRPARLDSLLHLDLNLCSGWALGWENSVRDCHAWGLRFHDLPSTISLMLGRYSAADLSSVPPSEADCSQVTDCLHNPLHNSSERNTLFFIGITLFNTTVNTAKTSRWLATTVTITIRNICRPSLQIDPIQGTW